MQQVSVANISLYFSDILYISHVVSVIYTSS